MTQTIETMKNVVKNWWLSLLIGILAIIVGIWCLSTPVESFVGITYVFVIAFLIGGIMDIAFAVSNRKTMNGWGWTLAAGILEVLFGILFMCLPTAFMMGTLIYFVGFWILFRSIWGIGEAFQLQVIGVKGWGWLLALSIISVILSFIYLLSPAFGGVFIVVYVGLSMLFYGIFRIILAFDLQKINKQINK